MTAREPWFAPSERELEGWVRDLFRFRRDHPQRRRRLRAAVRELRALRAASSQKTTLRRFEQPTAQELDAEERATADARHGASHSQPEPRP